MQRAEPCGLDKRVAAPTHDDNVEGAPPAPKRRVQVRTVFSEASIQTTAMAITVLVLSPDGVAGLLINRGSGRMLDLVAGKPGSRIQGPLAHERKESIRWAALSDKGSTVVSVSHSTIATWNGHNGALRSYCDFEDVGCAEFAHDVFVPTCCISRDGTKIVLSGRGRKVLVLESRRNEICEKTARIYRLGELISPARIFVSAFDGKEGIRCTLVCDREPSRDHAATIFRGTLNADGYSMNEVAGPVCDETGENVDLQYLLQRCSTPRYGDILASPSHLLIGGHAKAYMLKFDSPTSGDAESAVHLENFCRSGDFSSNTAAISDTGIVASGDNGGCIRIHNPDSGFMTHKLRVAQNVTKAPGRFQPSPSRGPIAMTPDGQTVVAACGSGSGHIWIWRL